jgi:hypothetical protein
MGPNEHDEATPSAEPPETRAKPDPEKTGADKPEETGADKKGWSPEQVARDAVSGSKEAFSSLGTGVANELKKPTTGAAIAGGLVVGSAIAVGALETAVGALAAYVVYHTMKKKKA